MSNSYRSGYLKSDHWKNLRLEKLVKSGTLCHFCRRDSVSNDVHHVKYPKDLKDTKLRHLRVLCRGCHDLVHEALKQFPAINKLESSSARWRVTEQHVRRALGQKISFPRDTTEDIERHESALRIARTQVTTARMYASKFLKVSIRKPTVPVTDELAEWVLKNPSSDPVTVLLMASIFAGTGLTLSGLYKNLRSVWWKTALRMRHKLPTPLKTKDLRSLCPFPQPNRPEQPETRMFHTQRP